MTAPKLSLCALGLVLFACGSSNNTPADAGSHPDAGSTPRVITITAYTFSPDNLAVKAGDTVTVNNTDSFQHTVTSQSAAGNYTPGSVQGVSFDTGGFQGTTTFTIPANAPSGTVIPYYCSFHTSMMKGAALITVQ